MKIAVAGTGYVGLVTGVTLATMGHKVTCVDVNEEKIEMMKKGISPIYEEGLEDLMKSSSSNLTYTTDYKIAYKDAEAIYIGVGTPEKPDGSANLEYVFKVCDQIAEAVEKDCVVIIKSTVPIGTNDKVESYLRERVATNIQTDVVSNPEFLAQGTAVRDTLHASRIVVGTENDRAKEVMKKIYEPLTKEPYNVPYVSIKRRSAEMVKYASNDFLALKISYMNEIANLCEALGSNIDEVALGMSYDSRIGNKFLNAGIGYGGSCFPKDTKALHFLSKEMGSELTIVKAAIEVNKHQKTRLFEKLNKDYEGKLEGLKVGLLGVTFKPGTDDLREAPSIDNVKLLLESGCEVSVYDPIGLKSFERIFGDKIKYCDSIDELLKLKDVVMIMTEWPEVKNITLDKYVSLMKTPVVYDGRNCYSLEETKEKGIKYNSIGR